MNLIPIENSWEFLSPDNIKASLLQGILKQHFYEVQIVEHEKDNYNCGELLVVDPTSPVVKIFEMTLRKNKITIKIIGHNENHGKSYEEICTIFNHFNQQYIGKHMNISFEYTNDEIWFVYKTYFMCNRGIYIPQLIGTIQALGNSYQSFVKEMGIKT